MKILKLSNTYEDKFYIIRYFSSYASLFDATGKI